MNPLKPLIIALLALIAWLLLPSCETVSGKVYYIDQQTGAKGGIEYTEGQGGWFIKWPWLSDDGTQSGTAEIGGTIPLVDPESGK